MNVSEDDACCSSKEPTQRVIHTICSPLPNQLDLRGKRYEEALSEVDQYLDSAILAGYPSRLLSTERNRRTCKGITENHRSVKSFEFAPANQGGNGATIVISKAY